LRAHKTGRTGFSLVELSIVLVVIGLLVGGVLTGKSLIESSQRRSLLADIASINTATMVFKDKYLSLPGDTSLASSLNLPNVTSPGCQANSYILDNGIIDIVGAHATCTGYLCGCEQGLYVRQLSNSGMISNQVYTVPASSGLGYVLMSKAYSNAYILPYNWGNVNGGGDGVHWLVAEKSSQYGYYSLPGVMGISGSGTWNAFSSSEAYFLDGKIDDGMPLTGTVRMKNQTGLGVWVSGYIEYGNCATSNTPSTSTYQNEDAIQDVNGKRGCNLAFRSSF
jgi:prepilin-type N-terminal cleavage/methylation domain-containing protein